MTESRQSVSEQEPIGIILSRGSRSDPAPRVWAYVWGQAPQADPAEDGTETKAA